MARRNVRLDKAWTPDKVRERIRTSMIVMRLQKHVHGEIDMSPTQIAAAQTLLRKVLPDLVSSTLTVQKSPRLSYAEKLAAQVSAATELPEPTVQ